MTTPPAPPSRATVPLRRLVGAAFLHFGIVAYLVVVPVACLLLAPRGTDAGGWLALGVRVSGVFLAGLAALALVSVGIAAAVDAGIARRERRSAGTEPARSRRRLAVAVETGRGALPEPCAAILARVAHAAWHHDDPRDQTLARDLERVVATAVAALAAAPDAGIAEETAAALRHLEVAVAELATTRAALAGDEARTVAAYVRQRYGGDFPIRDD